jgi:alcohol dehydrogenase
MTLGTDIRPGVYENGHQWRRVEHGEGCLANLGRELARLRIERPFLVTTRSLVASDLLAQVKASCGVPVVGQFSEAQPHTPREVVVRAAGMLHDARPDGVVSFGGSTVVDTAKGAVFAHAAAIARAADFDRWTQEEGTSSDLDRPVLPHVAIPTTLSGAEYSRDIGITNEALRRKEIFRYDAVSPQSIFLDPAMTLATPPRLWAATGIKVMSDAIEQIYSRASHPAIDAQCLAAIRAFSTSLPESLRDGGTSRIQARLRCQIASWQALFGMHDAGTRVGIGGALRHQLGGMFRIPHGEATCVMLPHLLRYNFPAIPDRYAALAEAMLLREPFADDDARLEAIVARVEALVRALDLPTRLGPLGVRRADLPAMADHVMQENSLAFNPRAIAGKAEIVRILEAAL